MKPLLDENQTIEFINAVGRRYGCLYCWPTEENGYSGKDLPIAKFKSTYDCSGVVTSSLYEITDGALDRRTTWNAHNLMKNCQLVRQGEQKPGDLVFYGSKSRITHVMTYIGHSKYRHNDCDSDHTVVGASGGDSRTVDPEMAQKMHAKVTSYKSHKYRNDFVSFGRLVTND